MALKPAGKAVLVALVVAAVGVVGWQSGILDKMNKPKQAEVSSSPLPQAATPVAEREAAPAPQAEAPAPAAAAPTNNKGDAFDSLIRQSGTK